MGSYGRNQSFPTVSGHSGLVTDFDFSPFDDALLCTGSEDSTVSIHVCVYVCTEYMCVLCVLCTCV